MLANAFAEKKSNPVHKMIKKSFVTLLSGVMLPFSEQVISFIGSSHDQAVSV